MIKIFLSLLLVVILKKHFTLIIDIKTKLLGTFYKEFNISIIYFLEMKTFQYMQMIIT